MKIAAVASPARPLPRARPEDVGMSSGRLAKIGKVLDADIAAGRMPGAVLAIARRGKLVYLEAFGHRDTGGGAKTVSVPMRVDTIFNIASMTKPMTSVAALMLLEQGKLLIDDPLVKYFAKFCDMRVAVLNASRQVIVDKIPADRKITIQDLMRHTSGLIYGGAGSTAVHQMYPASSTPAARAMTGPEFLDKLSSLPLLWQPGAVWDYGFGLDILGLVVEALVKVRLGDYLQKNLFEPLGMVDTSFLILPKNAARYSRPKDPVFDLTQKLKFDCGGGGAASTASDYLRFAMMLLNKGKFDGKLILGRKTVEYMVSNQLGHEVENRIGKTDAPLADYGFGLGLAVRTTSGIVRRLGSVGDFSWPGAGGPNWWADPQEDLAVVFMSYSLGSINWHYRGVINAMVEAAICD